MNPRGITSAGRSDASAISNGGRARLDNYDWWLSRTRASLPSKVGSILLFLSVNNVECFVSTSLKEDDTPPAMIFLSRRPIWVDCYQDPRRLLISLSCHVDVGLENRDGRVCHGPWAGCLARVQGGDTSG